MRTISPSKLLACIWNSSVWRLIICCLLVSMGRGPVVLGSDIPGVKLVQADELDLNPDMVLPADIPVDSFRLEPREEDFLSTTVDPSTCASVDLFDTKSDSLIGDSSEFDKKKWYEKLSIRGYAQFRLNEVVQEAPGSAPPSYAGDNSVDDERNFLIRRARLVLSGYVHDRVFVYLQPDFASGVPGSPDADYYAQMRDWYADLYMTENKVHRFRVGQSKVPFGWENLQSSQNRIAMDRNDGMNSAVRNERDLGIFYYYTPEWVQDVFKEVMDQNLKGSGNYGMFGVGIYNGQGGSFRDRNDNLHTVVRYTYPLVFSNGQIIELGIQGYTGNYVVLGSPILPLGVGPAMTPGGTEQTGGGRGMLDQRLGGSFIMYPQPWGFQAEWNVGRGPGLSDDQTEVGVRSLYGGYAQLFYKYDSPTLGTFFPFARYTHFKGGYKAYRNAPYSMMKDWELGCEWQFNKATELTASYLFADRTNLNAMATGESYRAFKGDVLRFQLQVNY